jgi:acetylornithine deacetylase/succinyl-diaminopimelate desuccinylase-like protein
MAEENIRNSVRMSRQQEEWLETAWAHIEEDRLVRLLKELINIPSPTGEEGALAQHLVAEMQKGGLDAAYQEISGRRGNAVGYLPGNRTGPDLLFYGHLDTSFTGDVEEDYPATGPATYRDRLPIAYVENGLVHGLGAANPKGADVCALEALLSVKDAGIPLKGTAIIGLVSGGTLKSPVKGVTKTFEGPRYEGQGVGCEFMLKQGVRADFAINTKPGYAVAWEEPGSCWFRVKVGGFINYVGSKKRNITQNAILESIKVLTALESWADQYTERHTEGLIEPQVAIGAIEGGWPYKPSYMPAICHIYLDVRLNPRTTVMQVQREFSEIIDRIKLDHHDLILDWDTYLSVPGTITDPESWIVRSCIRAWEKVEEKSHKPRDKMSGVTDGNILRMWGIPTSRLGLDRAREPGSARKQIYGETDACSIQSMKRLTQCYVYSLIDMCTRDRAEVIA